jgi:hypothetical protein
LEQQTIKHISKPTKKQLVHCNATFKDVVNDNVYRQFQPQNDPNIRKKPQNRWYVSILGKENGY